jgi:ribosomal protein L29
MVEKFIDVRIDDYLKGLRKTVDQLRVHAEELRTAQARVSHGSDAGDVAQRLLLKRALSNVQEECSRLRRMLARVLTDLRSKNDFAISVSRDDPSFEREVGSILSSIDKAVGRIEDYFFLSQPTVHIGGLKNENMLIYLWQAQRMASAVEATM